MIYPDLTLQSIIYVVLLFILVTYVVRSINSYGKEKNRIARDSLDLNVNISENYSNILDAFIMEVFNEYKILNLSYNTEYIAKDKEKKIVSDVTDMVTARLSSTMIKQLSVYYNPAALPDIIAQKIYLVVMQYVIENNRPKESKK